MVYANQTIDKEEIESVLKESQCDKIYIERFRKDNCIPGALWHIFRLEDVNHLRDYLHQNKKANDPLHNGEHYLDQKTLDQLAKKKKFHRVCNIKKERNKS